MKEYRNEEASLIKEKVQDLPIIFGVGIPVVIRQIPKDTAMLGAPMRG